ncbi:DUF4429 domain-containing protein [Streptomyces fagopyri]|uniref:DUF4429 domain-containing protein n=1 Tax=Streptomyces fagopyri TaxID=2662397 RepID=A0A5Q0LBW1_9ACTN|nr:DUF4429 domain-containing protein [Streptomyces fagopyri]QFZ73999.1 DUF4429 domain-containing protein [Streptomyces fagopyri]
MIEVKGHTGQVVFDGEYVTITRKGFNARMTVGKGEKRIHVSQISGVQWKPAGMMVNGFIQLTVPGGNERRSAFGSQTTNAVKDENSVVFTKKQMPEFEKVRTEIEAAIAAHHAPQAQAAAAGSVADELAKLGALREQGLLSPEEFEQQKARLLGG